MTTGLVPDLTTPTPTRPAPVAGAGGRPRRRGAWRWVVLAVAGVYFLGPLLAAIWFTLRSHTGGLSFSAYRQIFAAPPTGQIGFSTALVFSLVLAAATIVLTLALMVPTQLLLHLRFPRVRPLVETLTLLPLVFPPIVLVVGVDEVYGWVGRVGGPLASAVGWSRDPGHPLVLALLYVVLALPFVYRSIDTGLRSIDTPTLVEAARGLGASWPTTLRTVLLPSLRAAVASAAFLCFALVMGEYTIASILLYTKPFPVWLVQLPTTSGQVQAAVSVFSLLLVELLLLLVGALTWRRVARSKA